MWKQSRACVGFKICEWTAKSLPHVRKYWEAHQNQQWNFEKNGNTRVVLLTFTSESPTKWGRVLYLFVLYLGDFVIGIAMSFVGIPAFWRPESFPPFCHLAEYCYLKRPEEGGNWALGQSPFFLLFLYFLETSQCALICVVSRIPRWSHDLHALILWPVPALLVWEGIWQATSQ